ncbi:MAG: lipoyl synthase [Candidatus Marinimicrobia bacterium]|nr:lipoyl synthase [Candidatus Neomarinimicrobiota bacterium]
MSGQLVTPALRRPPWMKVRLSIGENYRQLKNLVHGENLHTVCEEARCPNIYECWERRSATLMILGDTCTRSCGFCAVKTGRPPTLDLAEPLRVGAAVKSMGLRHCVITSVNRDELDDGGASVWAATIREIRRQAPDCTVEVLIPDFKGDAEALATVMEARPDVLAHNLETVPDLYGTVRPQADYSQSLQLLRRASEGHMVVKSGIMVGIGEKPEEVLALMRDAFHHGCRLFTIGQYLQPTPLHLPVVRYVTPEEFASYEAAGLEMGFGGVVSGPLVRSSYRADEQLLRLSDQGGSFPAANRGDITTATQPAGEN